MSKISRFKAHEVAAKMVNDVYRDRENWIRKSIQKLSEKIAKDKIPQEVLNFCEKWKQYIPYSSSLFITCLDERGNKMCYLSSQISFIVPSGASSISVVGAESDELHRHYESLCELNSIKNSLRNDITSILLDLGTTKKIEADFPVAAPYFEKVKEKVDEPVKPRECLQLIKKVESEMKKGDREIAYYKHPV